MTKPNRKALFFSLAISLLTQSAYSAPPSKDTPNVSPKVAAAEKPAKKTIRAQSPDTDESEESFFDAKLIPAGLNEVCVPASPNALNPWMTPDLNQANTPAPNAPTNYGSLNAGQGQISAQNSVAFAPGMLGDFFGGATNSTTTIRTLIDRTIFHDDGGPISPGAADDYHAIEPGSVLGTFQLNGGVGGGGRYYYTNGISPDGSPLVDGDGAAAGTGPFLLVSSGSSETIVPGPGDSFFPDTVLPVFLVLDEITLNVPSPSAGGGVGRMKLAENTSPLPRDRVFFNYSYFNNVPLAAGGVNVNRVTPGFEKTFLDGTMSIEVRAPFASTLDNTIFTDGATNTSSTQFGNLTTYLKGLLYSDGTFAFSAGLGLAVPTASDVRVRTVGGPDLVRIKNESVHLMPFIGTLWTPNDRLFMQSFTQFDFDTNGNPVSVTDFNGGLTPIGRANDVTYLFQSISAGYWTYRDPNSDSIVTGIAPMAELHYNRSLSNTDVVSGNGFQIGNFQDNFSLLNATVGVNMLLKDSASLTLGYSTPLGGGADRQFDGEFRAMLNWYFGTANRMNRVQF